MIVYTSLLIFNFIVMLICMFYDEKNNKNHENIYLWINFISIFLISGLRSSTIGTDTRNYESIFTTIGNMQFNYYNFWKFPGYSIYNLLLYKVTSWPQIITIMNSFFISLGIVLSIKKMSINPYFSSFLYITLYHFFVTMNATRQYMSILFLFLALYYFIENKKVFLFYFILAISFHQVSIIGMVYFVLYKVEWRINKYIRLIIITSLIGFSFDSLTKIFSRIFSEYQSYFNQETTVNLNSTGSGNKIILSLFLMIFIFMGLHIINKNIDKNNPFYRFMLACVIISLVLDILFSRNIMMIRVILYFNIMYVYFIPTTILYFSKVVKEHKEFRVLTSILTILIILIPFYYQLYQNMVDVLPYSFFWSK